MRLFEAVGVIILATAVSIGYFLVVQVRAEGPETPQKPPILLLKASQDNSRIEQTVTADKAALCLQFKFESSANHSVTIRVTEFTAEEAPLKPLIPTLSAGSCSGIDLQGLARVPSNPPTPAGSAPKQVDSRTDKELTVTVTPDKPIVELHFKNVRPKTTYKGKLYLFSRDKSQSWDIILKSGELPVLVVDKIAPQQLTIYNPFASDKSRPQFPIMLRTKSDDGPYTNVRVRVEDPNQAKSTVITSSFTADALSFKKCPGCEDLHLWSSGTESSQGSNQKATKDDARTIGKGSQRTIWAQVESLGTGEYSPVLRFMADGASETAEESKLALTLQIRHHWFFPGLVIFLGSLVGWFGSKYVIGYRTAGTLKRDAKALSEIAAFLARPDPRVSGWRIPGESASYALVRVRVILHQVGYLAKSVFRVIAGEQGIRDRLAEAKRRLDALHAFRIRRLALHELAMDRPTVQQKIGETLRRVLDILDRPTFGEDQKSECDGFLKKLEDWTKPDQADGLYCNAVKERISDLRTQVSLSGLTGVISDQMSALLRELKEVDGLSQQQQTAEILHEYDRKAAALSLLWRDRNQGWAQVLAEQQKNNASLEALYKTRDEEIWKCIKTHEMQLTGAAEAQSYDLVEVRLELVKSDAFSDSYLIRHPCQICWEVTPPGKEKTPQSEKLPEGADRRPRHVVTDGLTFAQYFRDPGTYRVSAYVGWQGVETNKTQEREIRVEENPEYRRRAAFDLWIEGIVNLLALLFAVLTGLQSQYGPTFGSFGQYAGLFLWAAGASIGGNLFKQLGTSRTAGGQESTLPSK